MREPINAGYIRENATFKKNIHILFSLLLDIKKNIIKNYQGETSKFK